MTKIDRYILFKFTCNFVLWLCSLVGIVVVFDLFTNLDPILRAGKEAGNTPKILAMYYFFKVVPMTNILTPLLGLFSAMITIAMMMRINELVPIQAAGVSQVRIIRPLIFAVLVVTLGSTGLREVLLPRYIEKITDDPQHYVVDRGVVMNATIDNETGMTLQGVRVFRETHRITEPVFVLQMPLTEKPFQLRAKEAFHEPAREGRPAGFRLTGVQDWGELTAPDLLTEEGRRIVRFADGDDRLEDKECFVVCGIPFMYFAANKAWEQYASTWELLRATRGSSLSSVERLRARIHSRIVTPFLDMTLLFLGLPIILMQGDRNVFKAIGITALMVIAFIIVKEACGAVGESHDMPVLGAWLPLMVFIPIAANSFYGMTK